MRRRRRPTPFLRWLGAVLSLVAVGALWYEFAPSRIGGSANYAVIDGISMNPKLHAGDLVLTRPATDYEVGDIVAYHNLQLGRLVLHRIVGRDGDTYVFKGDNNSFLDAYHPTQAQLVGRFWFHIPKVGGAFTWLHEPGHAAIATAVLALFLLAGGGAARRRRRHGRRSGTHTTSMRANPALGRTLLSVAAALAVIFGLLAFVAFRHDTVTTIDAPGAYTQQGIYSYSADVPPSTLYPSGHIRTGQTVFTRVADSVSTSFAYSFLSALPHDVHGTAVLAQTLESSTGWTKKLPSPVQHFTGDHVTLNGTLDLTALEAEMQQYAKLTGITNDSFTVALTPTVVVSGNVGVTPLAGTTFVPTPVTFALDQFSLRMENTAIPTTPGVTPTSVDALHPSEPGVVAQTQSASVKVLVGHLHVVTARRVSIIGLVVAALVALLGLLLLASGGKDELSNIQRRGGDLLVPVSTAPAPPPGGYIDVTSFDGLDQLARSYELVILHHQRGAEHGFYIDDDGSIYRYRVNAAEEIQPEPAQA